MGVAVTGMTEKLTPAGLPASALCYMLGYGCGRACGG
jgi:hypothetical protein